MKNTVAKILKESRKKKGFTTEYVVEELKKYGIVIAPKTLYSYEAHYSSPNADMFLCLCRIYGIDNIDIFFDDAAPKKSQTPYDKLNDAGKAKADEYITDLSFNPKYTVWDNETKLIADVKKSIPPITDDDETIIL